jgi:multiple sugar transport system ATP-binding protein
MIVAEGLTKTYGDIPAVRRLDFEVRAGEIVALVGTSGCGKSTTLKMINRLIEPSAGRILVNGVDTASVNPEKLRLGIGYAIQGAGLFPHWNVADNIATVPRLLGWDRRRTAERVEELLELIGLPGVGGRFPAQLSGGQRQRVAVARAIVRDPSVFLFDEPLSNLDAKLRVQMRAEITKLQQRLQTTCVYVTHDQIEAMTMGHRMAVLNAGKIQQIGTPLEVYDTPANVFVAQFIGTPPMNFFNATVRDGQLDAAQCSIPLPAGRRTTNGQKVRVGIRPENILSSEKQGRGATARVQGVVDIVEPVGHQAIVHSRVGDDLLVAAFDSHNMPRVGQTIDLVIELDAVHLFDAATETRL